MVTELHAASSEHSSLTEPIARPMTKSTSRKIVDHKSNLDRGVCLCYEIPRFPLLKVHSKRCPGRFKSGLVAALALVVTPRVWKWTLSAAILTQVACSTIRNRPVRVPSDFEGFWRGQMVTSRELTRNIDLSIIRNDDRLQGVFRCSFGSTTCLNDNSMGRLSGRVGAASFQVRMQDASICRFSGEFPGTKARGQYSCYSGGNLIEHGSWRISHPNNY